LGKKSREKKKTDFCRVESFGKKTLLLGKGNKGSSTYENTQRKKKRKRRTKMPLRPMADPYNRKVTVSPKKGGAANRDTHRIG